MQNTRLDEEKETMAHISEFERDGRVSLALHGEIGALVPRTCRWADCRELKEEEYTVAVFLQL